MSEPGENACALRMEDAVLSLSLFLFMNERMRREELDSLSPKSSSFLLGFSLIFSDNVEASVHYTNPVSKYVRVSHQMDCFKVKSKLTLPNKCCNHLQTCVTGYY